MTIHDFIKKRKHLIWYVKDYNKLSAESIVRRLWITETGMALNKKGGEIMAEEKLIGKITHYFPKIGVAVIELSDTLKVGDTIHIKNSDRDFNQQVFSMQIEHERVEEAIAGQSVGLKIDQKVHEGDKVYLAIE